jgi:REP element-mobilizing transposase RayT
MARPRSRPVGGVTHDRRPWFRRCSPVHITVKVLGDVPNLRRGPLFRCIRKALVVARERFGLAIVHYSVQKTHVHLIAEADDKTALSRGMQGLGVRLARRLNKRLGRRGTVFKERYHARLVRDAVQARRALLYVLNNARRHAAQRGWYYRADWCDPCSSASSFEGWRAPPRTRDPPHMAAPTTWLLSAGWRMWGPLDIGMIPGLPVRL